MEARHYIHKLLSEVTVHSGRGQSPSANNRDVNETLTYETKTRPRRSLFGPRQDQDQDLPAIPRDRDI